RNLGDLIGVGVDRGLSGRVRIEDRLELGRRGEHFGAEGGAGHEINEGLAEALTQPLIVGIEEYLIFHDGSAKAGAKLMQRERRQRGVIERRARVERIAAGSVERAAVIFIGAALRYHVNLRAASGSS